MQNRFNVLFQKFIQVFTTATHPLVIFLDDLQWADSASLQLLKVLMESSGYLLVLGAYRNNEVPPAHPLMLTIADLKKNNLTVNTLTLAPLSLKHTNHLIADTLRCTPELANPLTELIDRKTQGNPFFTTQFLKALYEDQYITFERDQGYWQCDMAHINDLALTDNVVEFMALQLQKLPENTQQMLKLAACIGNQFNLETLAIVAEQSLTEAAKALWTALQEGLIVPLTQVYKFFHAEDINLAEVHHRTAPVYRFLHDRIQQAAYSLIPEDQKQWTHYHIGQLLLQQTSPATRDEQIFELVNQLNYGISLIRQPSEKIEVAQLNLIAAQKARSAAAYDAAQNYAELGVSLLGEKAWEEQYDVTLSFYELAAEIAFLTGDFPQMEECINTVISRAQKLLDKINVYKLHIKSRISLAKFPEALIIGQDVLQELGITFSPAPTSEDIQTNIQEITELIGDRDIIDLLHLPENVDKLKLAIIQITTGVAPAAYLSGSPLFPLLVSCAVKLSIESGNTADSALAYSLYSIVTCNVLQDVDGATAFSQLALELVDKLDAKAVKPEIYSAVGLYILHRKSPVIATLPLFSDGYTAALDVGNLEYLAYNANEFCTYSFFCGQPLTTLAQESQDYCQALVNFNQLAVANYCRLCWQSTLNLLGQTDDPTLLAGEAVQETELLPFMLSAHDLSGLYFFYLYKIMLCYLFREIDLANHDALEIRNYLMAGAGTLGEAVFYFYDSLIALAQLPSVTEEAASTLEQRVECNQTQLEFWAHHAPMNHQHKVDLVSAERLRVLGQSYEAGDYYDRAIAGAKENGYTPEEALANELAGQFYLDWGKQKVAAAYIQEAYYCYTRWGAKAKVDDLEQRYPQLLQPILQAANQPLTVLQTLSTISESTYSVHTYSSKSVSRSSTNQVLDFVTLLQVSQTFASTIALDELLETLAQTMLENSGADQCALILCEDDQWQVRVMANLDQVTLQSTSVDDNPSIPAKLIQYVKNTMVMVSIDDLDTDLPVIDDYLDRHHPKSVLCLPILKQGNLRAILYLENRSASGVFRGDRVVILNFLCTQAAISLENAGLYQKVSNYSHILESEVLRQTQALHQKNQELEQTLKDLQQTQAQLIQTEKMSSLGQLVAGIAHEINNPIGYIKGNITPLANYLEDLKDLLDLYQQEADPVSQSLQIKQEEIDLDFLLQDVEEILKSMTKGSDRIQKIVLSLQNFSRLNESLSKAVDLHSGLDSTLSILQHRLQRTGNFPEIKVVCNYGNLPRITCYPSQLNQVFLNILNNAIDAIRENPQCTDNPEIRIGTEALAQGQVRIAIANTDSMIPKEIQDRIFDPFFTTKPVGSGTGLGLFVSYSIIQKHRGELRVTSPSLRETEFEIILPVQ